MTLTRTLLLFFAGAALTLAAGIPAPYENVRGFVWVAHDLDSTVSKLQPFGLTEVHRDGSEKVDEAFRGTPISANIQHASARFGGFSVDFVQPGAARDAFSEFLKQHGDGIFALVSSVPNEDDLKDQEKKLKSAGVSVLEQVTFSGTSLTFFDTEAKGKYVLGLTTARTLEPASPELPVTHAGIDIQDPQAVSTYWQSLGWEPLTIAHATPRDDSRYRGQPLHLYFDVAWYKRPSLTIEWIIPPTTPSNCYADFLKLHGEGIQHLGMTVPDLDVAVARYKMLGYSAWQSGAWGDVGKKNSGRYAYMDTDKVGGVAIEIIQTYN